MSNGSTSPRRLLLIANPISGGGRGRLLAPQLAAALAARSVHAEVYFTTAAGDARARARKAGSEAWDGLVAIGGDGTVNEVLNGMPDPSRPLGTLPVGTANVLAQGHVRRLAIGRSGEQRLLLCCGCGVDGEIVRRVAARRSGTLGKHKYLVPIAQTLWHWPRFTLRATLADGEVLDDLGMVLVTRVRGYGGVLRLPREVSPDSGLLHVLGFRHRTRTAWLGLGLCGLLSTLRQSERLLVRSTTSVRIDGDAPMQLDGDAAGRAPAVLQLLPETAAMIVP